MRASGRAGALEHPRSCTRFRFCTQLPVRTAPEAALGPAAEGPDHFGRQVGHVGRRAGPAGRRVISPGDIPIEHEDEFHPPATVLDGCC